MQGAIVRGLHDERLAEALFDQRREFGAFARVGCATRYANAGALRILRSLDTNYAPTTSIERRAALARNWPR